MEGKKLRSPPNVAEFKQSEAAFEEGLAILDAQIKEHDSVMKPHKIRLSELRKEKRALLQDLTEKKNKRRQLLDEVNKAKEILGIPKRRPRNEVKEKEKEKEREPLSGRAARDKRRRGPQYKTVQQVDLAIERIEYRIMSTSLTLRQERPLIEQISALREQKLLLLRAQPKPKPQPITQKPESEASAAGEEAKSSETEDVDLVSLERSMKKKAKQSYELKEASSTLYNKIKGLRDEETELTEMLDDLRDDGEAAKKDRRTLSTALRQLHRDFGKTTYMYNKWIEDKKYEKKMKQKERDDALRPKSEEELLRLIEEEAYLDPRELHPYDREITLCDALMTRLANMSQKMKLRFDPQEISDFLFILGKVPRSAQDVPTALESLEEKRDDFSNRSFRESAKGGQTTKGGQVEGRPAPQAKSAKVEKEEEEDFPSLSSLLPGYVKTKTAATATTTNSNANNQNKNVSTQSSESEGDEEESDEESDEEADEE